MNEKVQLNSAKSEEKKIPYDIVAYTRNENDIFYSIDDAVNRAGYGKFQIRLLMLAGLGWFADAAETFILAMIGDFIACDWELHRWQVALLTSVVFAGIMIGSPILGTVADVYGRKMALTVSVVLLFSFGAISAASPNYTWMVVFRTCMGFALAGVGQGLTLCSEYCPPNMRGRAGFYLCYFWSLGSVGVIFLAWIIMKYLNSWRILLVSTSVPAFLVILSLKWYPESARYYLVSNQYKKATDILQKMADTNGVELPPGKLVEVTTSYRRGRIKDLLGKEYRLTTLLIWYIWLASAFAYYGIALVSPIIVQKGNLIVDKNSTESLADDMNSLVPCAKFSQQFYIDLLWTTAAEFPGIIIFTLLVECMSRKALLCGSCIISSVLVLLLLLRTHKIIILLVLFGARAILLAVFQLIYIMTTELFPTTFRALAMGTGSSFCRLGGIMVPYVAQVLVIDSPIAAMSLLAGVIFLSGIAALFLPFETKGMKMKDVLVEKS
ncbi:synaptic vesicle 2-related protein isoform X2 [Parasteatoda tepidariorum]|uniref:synaptic vesicle 2-related protein isoform X1 n=1 Tax=Parasteatoda tepidariorum TaxID=114398 RepID=UPI001C728A8E|nr:synaptic vesicle 2-related protein isoform X1 [Parasteatoda tepidariorum]XP_042903268.1 synaptic vesicle 2-related protein isoform X2 [Parasteatoda tepidariorum]